MEIMKNFFNPLLCFCFIQMMVSFCFISPLSAQDKVPQKKKRLHIAGPGGTFDYDVELMLKSNQVINYSNYGMVTPMLEGGVDADARYHFSKKVYLDMNYNFNGQWFIKNADKSDFSMSGIRNALSADLNLKKGSMLYSFDVDYDWVYRPKWPDLYQPDPPVYDAAFDVNNIRYQSTDRYSYHKVEPKLRIKGRIKRGLYAQFKAGYIRKSGYVDSNYDPTVPTHLTPDRYHAGYGEVKLRYSDKRKPVNFSIKNRTTYLGHSDELARDRVTGLTHYSTSPNPLYREMNNRTSLDISFLIRSINMEITPGYSFEFNKDLFQDYYTFYNHSAGLEIKQYFLKKKLFYRIKGEGKMALYTSDGYGESGNHPPLKDGTVLYKRYVIASALVEYALHRNVIIFADCYMKLKKSNFPSYEPGVYPVSGTKNYEVDFSYNNYRVGLGAKYLI